MRLIAEAMLNVSIHTLYPYHFALHDIVKHLLAEIAHCVFVKMTFCQLGGYDHSVLYTSAQLTEGRSARDQSKQPPAKKMAEIAHC